MNHDRFVRSAIVALVVLGRQAACSDPSSTDPCAGETNCAPQYRLCINQEGSPACGECVEGYHWNKDRTVCTQDPCDPNPCTEPHKGQCIKNGEPFDCNCDPGYESNSSGLCIEKALQFVEVTAGYLHTCGLATDGRAFCWGFDYNGQLGNGQGAPNTCDGYPCSQAPVPVDVSGINPPVSFRSLTAGWHHTCGLADDGRAFCWGEDYNGQLGNGAGAPNTCDGFPCSQSPVMVEVTGINPPVSFAALTARGAHTCGLATDGSAFCWGDDQFGQLGNGAGAPGTCGSEPCAQSPVPLEVSGISPPVSFKAITGNWYHTCGLATDGRAFCWGNDGYGQLGNGPGAPNTCTISGVDFPCSQSPIPVNASGNSPPVSFTALTAGFGHTCGLADDGRALCWGLDRYGELGNGGGELSTCDGGFVGTSDPCSQSPVLVVGGIKFASLTAGLEHTCGLADDGRAFCWGLDSDGQLGNGPGAPNTCGAGSAALPCSLSPVLVDVGGIAPPVAFTAIAAGVFHTCGLADDGSVFCWGSDDHGQLGNGGGREDSQVPVLVKGSVAH